MDRFHALDAFGLRGGEVRFPAPRFPREGAHGLDARKNEEDETMKMTTKSLARAAMIAAIYAALTLLLQPLSFRAVQLRVSEALTLLPILTFDAVPGLFVGCLLANFLAGAAWYDVVFGSLATLIAAILTHKLRNHFALASLMPVLLNGLVVGPVVYFAYNYAGTFSLPLLLMDMGSVALGELVACCVLGSVLVCALRRTPQALWAQ